jgi:hypothetical protein
MKNEYGNLGRSHVRMARGAHGLSKVSPGPAMPYPFTPCGREPLKRPHGNLRSRPPVGWAASGRLLILLTPHGVRLWKKPSFAFPFPGEFHCYDLLNFGVKVDLNIGVKVDLISA